MKTFAKFHVAQWHSLALCERSVHRNESKPKNLVRGRE